METAKGDYVAFFLGIGLLAVMGCCGAYDLYAIYSGVGLKTISSYIREWSIQSPVLPFLAGIIAGHLFFGGH